MEGQSDNRSGDGTNQAPSTSSPAPLLRPPLPGSNPRNNGGPRTPRLGLAIPPSPSQKPGNNDGHVPDLPMQPSLPPISQISRPSTRPAPPQLRLATPLGSSKTPTDQALPSAHRTQPLQISTTVSGGSDGSERSRSDSFTMIDGKISNPTSASSSGFSAHRHAVGTPDPASAISSVYSETGASMEREGSHHVLPDLAKLSLERGRDLDVDDLTDDGWKAASEQKRIVELGSLGEGSGGAVTRCKLLNGKTEFALKASYDFDCKSGPICLY